MALRRTTATALAALMLMIGQLAAEEALTLQACLDIALDDSPMTRSAEEGVRVAQGIVGQARTGYYPEVNVAAHYSRFQAHAFLPNSPFFNASPTIIGPEDDWQYGVNGRYLLYDGGYSKARLCAAYAVHGQAQEEAQRIYQQIALDVSLAFYSLAARQELRDAAKLLLERAEEHFKMAKERKELGDVPEADVLRFEVELAQSRQTLARAEADVLIATGNLNMAMGLAPESCLTIIPEPGTPTEPDEECLCEALEAALDSRPELLGAENRLRSLYAQINAARSATRPKMTARGLYSQRDNAFPAHDAEWFMGLSFDWPILATVGPQPAVNQARAEWAKAQAEYEQQALQVKQQVWQSFANLQTAYQSTRLSQAQVNNAREGLRLIEERFKVNAATSSALLDAHSTLTRAESSFVQAQWNYRSTEDIFLWSQGLLCVEEE